MKSPLTISPQAIALGSLKPGQKVSQKLVLLGQKPFKVASITAAGWDIDFQPTTEARKMHLIQVSMSPTTVTGGPFKSTLEITTEGQESVTANALITADLRVQ